MGWELWSLFVNSFCDQIPVIHPSLHAVMRVLQWLSNFLLPVVIWLSLLNILAVASCHWVFRSILITLHISLPLLRRLLLLKKNPLYNSLTPTCRHCSCSDLVRRRSLVGVESWLSHCVLHSQSGFSSWASYNASMPLQLAVMSSLNLLKEPDTVFQSLKFVRTPRGYLISVLHILGNDGLAIKNFTVYRSLTCSFRRYPPSRDTVFKSVQLSV